MSEKKMNWWQRKATTGDWILFFIALTLAKIAIDWCLS